MTICDRKYNFDMGRYTIAYIKCYNCGRLHYNVKATLPGWFRALERRDEWNWLGQCLVRIVD